MRLLSAAASMSVRYASCPGTFFSLPYVATIFAERLKAAGVDVYGRNWHKLNIKVTPGGQ